jgi:3-oxoacyl-[acyl-carrier protein] reductase
VLKGDGRIRCREPFANLVAPLETREHPVLYMQVDQQQQWVASFPLGRMEAPEGVALATLFLASKSSSRLTSVTLDVTGGKVLV